MKLKTPNHFVQCSCGTNVLIEYIDEIKVCKCGKEVRISDKVKQYLIERDINHKKDWEININGLIIKPIEYISIKD